MSDVIALRKYIGRDYHDYNCLDLVRDFYADHFGVLIRNYFDGPVPSREGVQTLIASNKGEFEKVDTPKFGDIIVIRLFGVECHIGIYINEKRFLHSIKGAGSSLDLLERYSRMIAGYYRHREHHDPT